MHHRLKTPGLIDPVRGLDGAITHWSTRSGAHASVAPNTDLLTPELAAALQAPWERYEFARDISAMVDAGELERFAREEGPTDPLLDDDVDEEPSPAPPHEDQPPPFCDGSSRSTDCSPTVAQRTR